MKLYNAALYIHIPFCSKKCDYCDFYSITNYSYSTDTVQEITKQIENDKNNYGIDRFLSLYIGGGTPGSLSPDLINSLLNSIRILNQGVLPEEVTLECNPVNISKENLTSWQMAGITRISLGIQTFQDSFLNLAGRNSSRKKILQALALLGRHRGFELSLDLIQGLPGMTAQDQLSDLKEALHFHPDHISWYSLSLEKGTVLEDQWENRQTLDLPDETDEQVWEGGCLLLEQAGYNRYEVSNFSLPGKSCDHNRAYWEMRPYLGCGPGAVSMIRNPEGRIERHRVVQNVKSYADGTVLLDNRELPDPENFLKDYLLMGLRVTCGIDLDSFRKIFACEPEKLFPLALERFQRAKLIEMDKLSLKTTSAGLDMLNTILISFFDELDTHSYAGPVNWPLSKTLRS